jgi:hypothetical protein
VVQGRGQVHRDHAPPDPRPSLCRWQRLHVDLVFPKRRGVGGVSPRKVETLVLHRRLVKADLLQLRQHGQVGQRLLGPLP